MLFASKLPKTADSRFRTLIKAPASRVTEQVGKERRAVPESLPIRKPEDYSLFRDYLQPPQSALQSSEWHLNTE